jgi:hypothetical protein
MATFIKADFHGFPQQTRGKYKSLLHKQQTKFESFLRLYALDDLGTVCKKNFIFWLPGVCADLAKSGGLILSCALCVFCRFKDR